MAQDNTPHIRDVILQGIGFGLATILACVFIGHLGGNVYSEAYQASHHHGDAHGKDKAHGGKDAKAAPAKKRTVKAKPKAKGPKKASTRGERPPEPVRLEIGKTKRPPALDVTKTEVDPRSGKQKAAPVSKPKPKPAPAPKEPEAGEEAL